MDNIKNDILNQTTETTETNNNQPINNPTDQTELINTLLQENKIKNDNLIGQREVIKKFNQENSELNKTVEMLQEEIKNLKAQMESVNPVKINNEVYNKMFDLENQMKNIQQKEQKENIVKIMDLMEQYGVHPTEKKTIYQTMEQRWGINLSKNPSLDLVEDYLHRLKFSKQTQSVNNQPQKITNSNQFFTQPVNQPVISQNELNWRNAINESKARTEQKRVEWFRRRNRNPY